LAYVAQNASLAQIRQFGFGLDRSESIHSRTYVLKPSARELGASRIQQMAGRTICIVPNRSSVCSYVAQSFGACLSPVSRRVDGILIIIRSIGQRPLEPISGRLVSRHQRTVARANQGHCRPAGKRISTLFYEGCIPTDPGYSTEVSEQGHVYPFLSKCFSQTIKVAHLISLSLAASALSRLD
jgi:hypothetical protein